jgi:hypothetical protein
MTHCYFAIMNGFTTTNRDGNRESLELGPLTGTMESEVGSEKMITAAVSAAITATIASKTKISTVLAFAIAVAAVVTTVTKSCEWTPGSDDEATAKIAARTAARTAKRATKTAVSGTAGGTAGGVERAVDAIAEAIADVVNESKGECPHTALHDAMLAARSAAQSVSGDSASSERRDIIYNAAARDAAASDAAAALEAVATDDIVRTAFRTFGARLAAHPEFIALRADFESDFASKRARVALTAVFDTMPASFPAFIIVAAAATPSPTTNSPNFAAEYAANFAANFVRERAAQRADPVNAIGAASLRDIMGRSRGDAIWKAAVIFQTGWFVLQVVARSAEHLPVTELEILTLAFATVALVTYGLWWHKPYNVETHVCVHEGDYREGQHSEDGWILRPYEVDDGNKLGWWSVLWDNFQEAVGLHLGAIFIGGWKYAIFALPVVVTLSPLTVPYLTIFQISGWKGPFNPLYVSVDVKSTKTFMVAAAGGVAALLFGTIHLLAWSFEFPTSAERWLWRASSVAITAPPVVPFVVGVVGMAELCALCCLTCLLPQWVMDCLASLVAGLSGMFLVATILAYVAARLTLLVLAFTTLRHLPPGALETVRWTTFIPHI